MRIVFAGTPDVAVASLRALHAAGHDIVRVITRPDAPVGRRRVLTPSPVAHEAQALGLEVRKTPRLDGDAADAVAGAQLGVVVAYGGLVREPLLSAPEHGWVNLHFSLLPAWRGAAPVQHCLLAGDHETGVTCFVLEEGMDTGPILLRETTPVGDDETAGELTARLAVLGAPVLLRAVTGFVDGSLEPVPQDHDEATYAPKISPDDARLDWTRDAASLDRAVRAFNPVPGAHTTFDGARLKVHRVRRLEGAVGDRTPGVVVAIDDDGYPVVACGDGLLRLDEVQPAGKPRMDGAAFANGYRPLGQRLG